MDSFTISVARGLLAAVAVTVAKNDLRSYLNGVRVETGPKGLFLVATDGHRITVAHAAGEYPSWEGIMPVTFALACAKVRDSSTHATIKVHGANMTCHAACATTPLVDGTHPDWRMATNRTGTVFAPTAAVRINPTYVGELATQAKALKVSPAEIVITARRYASDEPGAAPTSALVQFGNRQDIFAVIMAIRAGTNAPEPGYPEWLTEGV